MTNAMADAQPVSVAANVAAPTAATKSQTPAIAAMNQVWGPWGETEILILRGSGDPETLWKDMAAQAVGVTGELQADAGGFLGQS